MMACTPARYVCIWSRFGAPPYMATDLMPMHLPKRADSFSVCCASSRVGDITSSPAPCRCGFHCCLCISTKAGNKNPRVLPLPVAAIPMTSLPWSASGQQYACTCDGPGKPALRSSTKSSGGNSRTCSKESIFTGGTDCSLGSKTVISVSWTVLPVVSPLAADSTACAMLMGPLGGNAGACPPPQGPAGDAPPQGPAGAGPPYWPFCGAPYWPGGAPP
mmetsp:Transcript_35477/g.114835  ORF Transcript_35477/g.114835 Transcript_35477/m.114835 type:complete len:218 (+) Transcript_35477:121-774(+)